MSSIETNAKCVYLLLFQLMSILQIQEEVLFVCIFHHK